MNRPKTWLAWAAVVLLAVASFGLPLAWTGRPAAAADITPPADITSPADITPPAIGLSDIAGHWAEPKILDLYARGIVVPKTGVEFRPNDKITRAEFCGFIARAIGLPTMGYAGLFDDVPASTPEAEAIEAAFRADIVKGTSPGRFSPGDRVTREQMSVMLLGAFQSASRIPPEAGWKRLLFTDAESISSWALNAVKFAFNADIINGKTDGRFAPADSATRAEAAAMVYGLLKSYPYIAADYRTPSVPVVAGSVVSLSVAPSDHKVVYAGGGKWGGLIKSVDGGKTWTNLSFSPPSAYGQGAVEGIVVSPTDAGLVTITSDAAYGWPAAVLQSMDGGLNWGPLVSHRDDLRIRGLAISGKRYQSAGYGGLKVASEGRNWHPEFQYPFDPAADEREDTRLGKPLERAFGYVALSPDGGMGLAAADYDFGAPVMYYSIAIGGASDERSPWVWDNFLTNDVVNPGPYWQALAFPPSPGSTFVIGTDLYDRSTRTIIRSFVDETAISGLAAYQPDETGKLLEVRSYSFSDDGQVVYALAMATPEGGGEKVPVILKSGDGGGAWTAHPAVIPGGAEVTAMAVAFGAGPSGSDYVFLADRGSPADPALPDHNLVGHVFRARGDAAGGYPFEMVYENRGPQ
ncbi:MAG TPA: S-layer homology domain-containing protein [Bacillota bacterium]